MSGTSGDLTAEECAGVRAALTAVTPHGAGGQEWTLALLFSAWRDVVSEVEEGYAWCAPELDNDTWCRDALARVWPLLPPRVRELRRPELDALDARFRTATIAWPDRSEEPPRWWEYRIPRILRAEPGERRRLGWTEGWAMLPFPKPAEVEVVE
ncbi:hypothetical protein [Streptomyces sp. NPDC051921]|uniref:hypothetical protein n=1 Tax=Streptomyces sp. NPDC051921 TaxID=3155806 RepID=UPI00342E0B83